MEQQALAVRPPTMRLRSGRSWHRNKAQDEIPDKLQNADAAPSGRVLAEDGPSVSVADRISMLAKAAPHLEMEVAAVKPLKLLARPDVPASRASLADTQEPSSLCLQEPPSLWSEPGAQLEDMCSLRASEPQSCMAVIDPEAKGAPDFSKEPARAASSRARVLRERRPGPRRALTHSPARRFVPSARLEELAQRVGAPDQPRETSGPAISLERIASLAQEAAAEEEQQSLQLAAQEAEFHQQCRQRLRAQLDEDRRPAPTSLARSSTAPASHGTRRSRAGQRSGLTQRRPQADRLPFWRRWTGMPQSNTTAESSGRSIGLLRSKTTGENGGRSIGLLRSETTGENGGRWIGLLRSKIKNENGGRWTGLLRSRTTMAA